MIGTVTRRITYSVADVQRFQESRDCSRGRTSTTRVAPAANTRVRGARWVRSFEVPGSTPGRAFAGTMLLADRRVEDMQTLFCHGASVSERLLKEELRSSVHGSMRDL